MTTTAADMTFYTTAEYFADLPRRIAATGPRDRVILATMAFLPDRPEIQLVLKEMCAAAQRGVDVRLMLDSYSFLIHDGTRLGPLVFNSEMPLKLAKPFRSIYEVLQQFEDCGGRYTIINQPRRRFVSPFSGRSHIKFAIINSRVYIGGCNLDTVDHVDLMAGWDDLKAANWLADLASKIMSDGSTRGALDETDLTVPVTDATTLMVDAGVPGQSIILAKALELIDRALRYIVITCQYYPDDITGKHLLAAHKRGVKVRVFYTHPSQRDWPYNILFYGVVGRARLSLPKSFFDNALRHDFLHAKLIATDQAALMGSNNYVSALVKFGTAETALLSYDPEFRRLALAALQRQAPTSVAGLV